MTDRPAIHAAPVLAQQHRDKARAQAADRRYREAIASYELAFNADSRNRELAMEFAEILLANIAEGNPARPSGTWAPAPVGVTLDHVIAQVGGVEERQLPPPFAPQFFEVSFDVGHGYK